MNSLLTRRSILRAAVSTAAATALRPDFIWARTPADARSSADLLSPFPLSSVRLLGGIFKEASEANAKYLDSLSVDRLLHSFRLTAGINSSAAPFGGWELPTCELRGHFAGGHYLSAVALAYASSGNSVLRDRGDAVVSGLAACQKAHGNGYLSAFPADLFGRLAKGAPVWAPFYTYHKIMAGLLDMYVHAGNEESLRIAEGMAKWVDAYFEGIGDDQRQRMLRVEYGGMNEALVNLFALTGKQQYLETAGLFEQPGILDPLAGRRDELTGLHANTNVPKMIGAARKYEVTGDASYRAIAEYFLDEILTARNYVIGNTSVDEHWRTPANNLSGTLGWTNAECCVAYNLMKLGRHVFGWTGDARWMDEYERTLFNCRLGTQNDRGLKQYFFPLASGYWRAYGSPFESFWCCTGTGAEEFSKFTDTIYSRAGDDLYVNQFIASALEWKDQGFTVQQETNFPVEQGTRLSIRTSRPREKTIFLRIPRWTGTGGEVKINDRPLEAFAEPGSYLALRRQWQDRDSIELRLPMRLREESLAGDPRTVAALYGPLVLAANLGPGPSGGADKIIHGRGTEPEGVPPPSPLPAIKSSALVKKSTTPDWIRMKSASAMQFEAEDENGPRELMPMYKIEDQKYSVYWKRGDARS